MEKAASLQRANQQQRLVEWSRRVEACRSSGLPVGQWCRENRIAVSTYFFWQRKVFQALKELQEVTYLEDGRLELSNNRAERSIKPFVMGRKNWLFSNTPAGAQSSAVIYSLIETAKENDLDPYRYLVWLLNTAPGLSQTDEAWAESFLPVNAPQECKIPK